MPRDGLTGRQAYGLSQHASQASEASEADDRPLGLMRNRFNSIGNRWHVPMVVSRPAIADLATAENQLDFPPEAVGPDSPHTGFQNPEPFGGVGDEPYDSDGDV